MAMRPGLESMDTAGITNPIKQITVGVTELSGPIHIPIGMKSNLAISIIRPISRRDIS